MAANPPSNPKSGTEHSAEQTVAPLTFEDKLQQFWQQNRMIVLGLCVLVLAAILGKGAWESYQRKQERDIEAAYEAAATDDQLKAFAASHAGHSLAAIAELRIADNAYEAGKASEALAAYEKAAAGLKDGPLATRAQLGRALAKIQSGNTTDGAADLKQIANDTNQFKTARAEAAYQLAVLAADAGNSTDLQKYLEQIEQIDPASPWARRAMMLRASLPTPATPAASATPTPAAAPKAEAETSATKSTDSAPKVQLNLPEKK